MTPTPRIYSERISLILDYLKRNKIQQYEVEERLNYTSLSKIKNYDKYPQTIIEKKTREEVYELLLAEFGLTFNESTDRVSSAKTGIKEHAQKEEEYYIMYYYAFVRETIGKAIVKISNNRHVEIDYRYDEHWTGTIEVVENYTFIEAEKQGEVTPVKKLICLFTGTKKSGRPILLGTYSTVKRDGIPAAGIILFERVDDPRHLQRKIKSDPDPRIAYYLMNKVFVTNTITPNTLDNINSTHKLIERYKGDYYLIYPKANNEILIGEMKCFSDSRALLMIKDIPYEGNVKPIDNHSIKFDLSDRSGFHGIFEDSIIILANTSKSIFDPFFYGVGISNALETGSNSFSCLLIERDAYDSLSEETIRTTMDRLKGKNSIASM